MSSSARLPESGTERDGRGWLDLEAEVRAQVTADLIALESTPLEFGAPIAWSITRREGVTVGFSPLHFVGELTQRTTCGVLIPEPVRRLPMSPAIARTMRKCPDCTAAMVKSAREKAA